MSGRRSCVPIGARSSASRRGGARCRAADASIWTSTRLPGARAVSHCGVGAGVSMRIRVPLDGDDGAGDGSEGKDPFERAGAAVGVESAVGGADGERVGAIVRPSRRLASSGLEDVVEAEQACAVGVGRVLEDGRRRSRVWRRLPAWRMAMRSATAAASWRSCVTSSAAVLVAARMSRRSARSSARVGASRAPNGSSSSSSSGASASARATLTRCASPPDRLARGLVGEALEAEALQPALPRAGALLVLGTRLKRSPVSTLARTVPRRSSGRCRTAALTPRTCDGVAGRPCRSTCPRSWRRRPPATRKQRGLAGAVGAEDRERLARGDGEVLELEDRADDRRRR